MDEQQTFAFGAPVVSCPPTTSERRVVYVLGAYPSGLHVTWKPPSIPGRSLKSIRAMIVDNEPTPFWDGSDASAEFERWRTSVGWRPEWGQVQPAPAGLNGPSGAWVDRHILKPLGVTRDQACLSDVLDQARLNAGQAARIEDTYTPVANTFGLAQCTLRAVPRGENGIVKEASTAHLDRLRNELRARQAKIIVTLGNAALRVARALLNGVEPDPGTALRTGSYGFPVQADIEGRPITWLPLVHPRSGERTRPWPDTHAAWEASKAER